MNTPQGGGPEYCAKKIDKKENSQHMKKIGPSLVMVAKTFSGGGRGLQLTLRK